ncbi:MAG: hypothetical protein AAF677_05555 [Pseudomonadota bacterium]
MSAGAVKRLVTAAFSLLAVAAVIAVLMLARAHWAELSAWRPTAAQLGMAAAAAAAYALLLALLAEGWHGLLRATAGPGIRRARSHPSFMLTQVGKYLPGNVFHLVGRHVWLARGALAHTLLLRCLLAETVAIAGAAGVVGLAMLPWLYGDAGPWAAIRPVVLLAAAAMIAAIAAVLRHGAGGARMAAQGAGDARMAAQGAGGGRMPAGTALWVGARTLALSIAFFAGQAGLFLALCLVVSGQADAGLVAIATVAWLVGFVTPGAPAGAGVRDLLLVVLAAPVTGEAEAIIATAAYRLVTVAGDGLLFAMGAGVVLASGRSLRPAPEPPAAG